MSSAPAVSTALETLVEARFARSASAVESFFADHEESIALACLEMARRFQQGGRLLVCGDGLERSDAAHVAVEFVHPVIVGKRALPAVALETAEEGGWRAALDVLGRPHDIAMAFVHDAAEAAAALAHARAAGMLTLALGPLGGSRRASEADVPDVEADFRFLVDETDPLVVQEVLETLYHILWELVHVFFERRIVR